MRNEHLVANAVALLSAAALVLQADDDHFGYVKGAQTESKGEWEVTQWTTARMGKESGRYLGMDFRTELEYGITDRLEAGKPLMTGTALG